MSSTGKISEFHPESDDAATYVMRLKHFMVANKIEDNNKLSFLITVLGSKVINTLVDLVTPDELDSKTYDQIIELFLNQYKPKKLTVAERNIFNTRRQKQFESVQEYIIVLKHLASTCKFGTFLNEALRDRLVSGVLDEELRQKLIIEDITFTKACEIAVKYEQAQKQTYGLPEVLVSDNGGTFVAEEFQDFLKKNKISRKLIPPYHACSNGAAEKSVQTDLLIGLKNEFVVNGRTFKEPSTGGSRGNFLNKI
ncbi:hypothetical protein JTE90_023397 [Oedothorax gibbosus]|uniref:Integrase catalytic domain-containing protein n=1 Tax=Oedothorax gibbosus TaxID=931172 RepID=A0AAV6UFJ3_9ARAC|nr:hypothetical protein JTE90_023397 [Oedothorax gibbosus]